MKPIHLLLLTSLAFGARAEEAPLAQLPSETRGKVHQTVRAVYPVRLLHEGVTSGKAVLLLEVDRKGTLTDVLPTAFTHRLFAEAAMTAARQWRYDPPRIGGEHIGLVVEVAFHFTIDGVLAVDRRSDLEAPANRPFGFHYVYEARGPRDLDRMPQPIDLPSPTYPEEWAEDGRHGRVSVVFHIDEAGNVRIPTVEPDSSPDEWLASVALGAVRRWRFEPCTSEGKPVLVRAQQTFLFGELTPTTAAAGKSRPEGG